jgi:branched-chain amino acid transport system substrate-binding protein
VVLLLKQCGDDPARENIMKQASHLDMELPLLLPGIRLKTWLRNAKASPN